MGLPAGRVERRGVWTEAEELKDEDRIVRLRVSKQKGRKKVSCGVSTIWL